MKTEKAYWDYRIINAFQGTDVVELHSMAVGDIHNEGHNVIICGGKNGLFWFRPDTCEHGRIAKGFFHVGLAVEDIDNDGVCEIIAAKQLHDLSFIIAWFKPGNNLYDPWDEYTLDDKFPGNPHDLLFADVDGDGRRELLSVAAYTKTPGVYIHKPEDDVKTLWTRHSVMEGHLTEGLSVGDIDGDGKIDIVAGADWYKCPEAGAFSGLWKREVYAPNFRDMSRTEVIDITGNGRGDIVAVESEYREGQLSWFEYKPDGEHGKRWVEHRIEDGMDFAHSLQAWKDKKTGKLNVFVGEMFEGGWVHQYNFNARLMQFSSVDNGNSWEKCIMQNGIGTHQAVVKDIDNDGQLEIAGKTWQRPVVQIFKKRERVTPVINYRHRFIDRDKPSTATDIFAVDINGDNLEDVACGKWWYKSPTWERYEIPGVEQVVQIFDVDGDGRSELICTKGAVEKNGDVSVLTSNFYWLKPVEPERGIWEEYNIGAGTGSWPHGTGVAEIVPGVKAFLAAYHSGKHQNDYPEIFEIPDNPGHQWPKKIFAEINYGEEIRAADINGNGSMDIIMGNYWFENKGNGTFEKHQYTQGFETARVCTWDINGDGRLDIIAGEEIYEKYRDKPAMVFAKLAWFENTGEGMWKMHVIDRLRSPHSLSVEDIDGDGQPEVICGEHDPFQPYRSRSRLFIYKKADAAGLSWHRYLLDDRFEHHDGAKTIKLSNGKPGIISHGWNDSQFVHLWEPSE